jgi:hypothetical protein
MPLSPVFRIFLSVGMSRRRLNQRLPKGKMSTDKFSEQVVQRKSLVVRYKVSLMVVARERVVRLQMILR